MFDSAIPVPSSARLHSNHLKKTSHATEQRGPATKHQHDLDLLRYGYSLSPQQQ